MARMRGDDRGPETMFSYVSAEQRVPSDHPLRAIRALVDDVLRAMSREFERLRGKRRHFGDSYITFLETHSLAEIGGAEDFAGSTRDRTSGRKVIL